MDELKGEKKNPSSANANIKELSEWQVRRLNEEGDNLGYKN